MYWYFHSLIQKMDREPSPVLSLYKSLSNCNLRYLLLECMKRLCNILQIFTLTRLQGRILRLLVCNKHSRLEYMIHTRDLQNTLLITFHHILKEHYCQLILWREKIILLLPHHCFMNQWQQQRLPSVYKRKCIYSFIIKYCY